MKHRNLREKFSRLWKIHAEANLMQQTIRKGSGEGTKIGQEGRSVGLLGVEREQKAKAGRRQMVDNSSPRHEKKETSSG